MQIENFFLTKAFFTKETMKLRCLMVLTFMTATCLASAEPAPEALTKGVKNQTRMADPVTIFDVKPMDVVFLLDGSDSTGEESFEQAKEFISNWIDLMTFGETKTRMAIIQASSLGTYTELNFKQSTARSHKWKMAKINNILFRGGKKATLRGLAAVREEYKNHPRPITMNKSEVKRTTFILTDGMEEEPAPLSAQEVDLMFLFDVTGSMSGQIANVKAEALNLLRGVDERFPKAKLRTGFVGYRDTTDAVDDQFVIHEFTSDINEFSAWVNANVRATGGGDAPEDVPGGIRKVMASNWEAPLTRILIHIADAPGHHANNWVVRGDTFRENEAQGLLEELKCTTGVYSYLFLKPEERVSGLEHMLQYFKEISATDCGDAHSWYPPEANDWFVSQSIKSESIIDRIIEETKITIEKVTYHDVKEDLSDVDLYGLGISSRADKKKLELVTKPVAHGRSRRSLVIIPDKSETLRDKTEEITKLVVGETNLCEPNPCKNGGTCKKISATTSQCNCRDGFLGNTCEEKLRERCNLLASRCKLYGYTAPECHKSRIYRTAALQKKLQQCQTEWEFCSDFDFGSWC